MRNEGGHTRRVGARGVSVVEDMARNGCSETSIAKKLRVATSTFREIKRRQPEVLEALERGYSAMEDELVDLLMRRARDPSHKGGVTAAIFLLKARRGYEGTKTPAHITINNDNRQQTMLLPSADEMDVYLSRAREMA
ncbi:hypothetical protein [Parvularcula marina]|uniref:hypothetical protein n=1 Tax=Parvularcula marina TaxID=2292771 RepID=UPI0011C079AB|nr:hypothetical protein [Parvularcula marina]